MIIDGKHTPIISQELWDTAQQKLAQNKKLYHPNAKSEFDATYMLHGLLRCSNCGARLTRAGEGVQCHKYAHGFCDVSHSISLKRLNPIVINLIQQTLQDGTFVLNPKTQNNDTQKTVKIKKQIQNEQIKLTRVKEAYECGIDTLDEYKTNKLKIMQTIKELEASMPDMSKKIDRKKFAKQHLSSLDIIKNPNVSESDKNNLLKQFVDKIVYNRSTNEVEIFYYC